MIVGVTKELKTNENRVAITPIAVHALVKNGSRVIIEKSAGLGSGITDQEFKDAGAQILDSNVDIYNQADLILKVSNPVPEEFSLFREGQIIFSFLYLANQPELLEALIEKKMIAIAYETVESSEGFLPILTPMSEIGGRMSVQVGAHYLEKANGGRGILLGGAPGVPPAKVAIIGGGIVGENAARIAIGLGANVTIIDKNIERMRYLENIYGSSITTLMSYEYNLTNAVKNTDLLIAAVLIAGAKPPILVTEDMVKGMKPGAVIVDVDIDHGGSIETMDRASTLNDPVYEKHGAIHYSVPNMPSSVPCTSTYALSNSTLPYLLEITQKGWPDAIKTDLGLSKGVNVAHGMVTNKLLAKEHNKEYIPLPCLWDY